MAALHFLTYTGKVGSGNKLETSVYEKLTDPANICYLKADSLMYFHVYADLVMLSKSTSLSKTAFDMNIHYLKLQLYLEEIERNPSMYWTETIMSSGQKKHYWR